MSVSPTWAVMVQLEWDYETEPPGAEAVGFMVYRGIGTECDNPDPLAFWSGSTARDTLTFAEEVLTVSQGVLCYEVTAFNGAGESGHSNRATALAESLVPAVPSGLSIGILME